MEEMDNIMYEKNTYVAFLDEQHAQVGAFSISIGKVSFGPNRLISKSFTDQEGFLELDR